MLWQGCLYLISLEKYIIELDSFYMKYSDGVFNRNIIFLKKTDLIKSIPSTINGVEIVVLGENWKDIYRENDKELIQLKILPIEVEYGIIKISLGPYHGSLE